MVIELPLIGAATRKKNDKRQRNKAQGWANTGRYGRALTTMVHSGESKQQVEGVL